MLDKGELSLQQFQKVVKSFFYPDLSGEDIDFIIKLAPKTVDLLVNYREFCKFLSRRFVRTFKKLSASAADANSFMRDIDNQMRKEPSLTYIIRKAADLNIDLRVIFVGHDEN